MAERRMLWKTISRSKKVNFRLSSIEAKLLYTWSIPYLDREGLMEADAATLKAMVVPLIKEITEDNIDALVMQIGSAGLWEIYEVDNTRYIRDPVFLERQNVHSHEAGSQIIKKIKGLKPMSIDVATMSRHVAHISPLKKERKKFKEFKRKNISQEKIALDIYGDYPKKADKNASLKSICKLLKAGVAKEELIRAQNNYKTQIEEEQTPKNRTIQSNNFYGLAQRWREFINPEMDEDGKALRDFERLQEEIRAKKDPGKTGDTEST